MTDVLLVAATRDELCGNEGLACGIGPVDAAAATARALAIHPPEAVVHVGVAGALRITPGAIVIGTEAVYCDLSAGVEVVHTARPDAELLAVLRDAFPDALALPIGTSAAVGGPCSSDTFRLRVEAMEGFAVLRACAAALVPAIEVRAVSNSIGESDRGRWQIARALASLGDALPRLLAAVRN